MLKMPTRRNALALATLAADLGNTTIVDGFAWSRAVNPEENPVANRASLCAETCRTVAPQVKAAGSRFRSRGWL